MPATVHIDIDAVKRGSLEGLKDFLLVCQAVHRLNPYAVVSGAASVALALAPYLTPVNPVAKLWMTAGSIPLSLTAASQFGKQATEDERREAEERYRHQLRLAVLEDSEAIKAEAALIRVQAREYADLPAHLRPDRFELRDYKEPKKDIAESFLERALKGIDDALDEDDELPTAAAGEAIATATPQVIGGFSTIDLADEAAKNDKSLLISGISGVGKTFLLRHIIHAIHRSNQGNETVLGIDFKGTTGHFCGLERSSQWITSPAPGHNYGEAIALIREVVDELGSRESELPLYLICDEINNGLEQAKAQPSKQGERKPEEVLKSSLKFIATQGRERLIRGVMTAHGNLMGMLGIDGDTAQSLVCAVLGRKVDKGDGFALIGKVLQNQVLFSKQERVVLAPKFDAIRAIAERTKQAIALTNIRGDWEFVLLPGWYANDPGLVKDWGVQNQSATQLITGEVSMPAPAPKPVEAPAIVAVSGAEPPPPRTNEFIQWLKEVPELIEAEGWFDLEIICAAWREMELIDFAKFLGAIAKAGLGEFKPGSMLESFRVFATGSEAKADDELLSKVRDYLSKKKAIPYTKLLKNTKIPADQLKLILDSLISSELIRIEDGLVEFLDSDESDEIL